MHCSALAKRIESIDSTLSPIEVSRICTLMTSSVEDTRRFENDEFFLERWDRVDLQLSAAVDQHAAVTEELVSLAQSDPFEFTPDQVWSLVRALKGQSQVIRLYVGDCDTGHVAG